MKVNLYYNFYKDENENRNDEINYCFDKIIKNDLIDRIYVFRNENDILKDTNDKIIEIINERPTYNDFFKKIGENSSNEDINIIINSDCFIDEKNINIIKNNLKDGECFCLSRRDISKIEPFEYKNLIRASESQDCWIVKGKVKETINADFYMGTAGCDNKIAYLFYESGYSVLNPSQDIKIYHYHLTNIRHYSKKTILSKPFLLVSSCFSDKKDSKLIVMKDKIEKKQILFSVFGRSGDVILASIISNTLTDMNYNITVLTLPKYRDLVLSTYKNVNVKILDRVDPKTEIIGKGQPVKIDISKSKFSYYIDGQVGSDFNYDNYINSKMNPINYLIDMVKEEHKIDLKINSIKEKLFLIENNKEYEDLLNTVIIAPKAITAPALTHQMVNNIYFNLKSNNEKVKILYSENLKNEYSNFDENDFLFGYSFVDCLYLIKNCKLFVGNDSGLAWGALYSDCQKHIYHWKNRIEVTQNYFSKIDSSYNDILI